MYWIRQLLTSATESDLQAFDRELRKQRTPRWCLQRFGGLLKELATWHAKGVVHCDIKPENVAWWCEDEQRYVLIDFGHAISADEHAVVKRGTTTYTALEALGGAVVKNNNLRGQLLAASGEVWSLGLTRCTCARASPDERCSVWSIAVTRLSGEGRCCRPSTGSSSVARRCWNSEYTKAAAGLSGR